MKKPLLLLLCLAFIVGCNKDSEINSENDSLDLTENVDLTNIVNPDTARASAEFDNSTNGLYKGVFVSEDASYHGTLTINLGNDGKYNAILEYGDDQRLGFLRVNHNSSSNSNVMEFRGGTAGFTVDVNDFTKPVITGGYIDGKEAQMRIVKEMSASRVTVVLGTFSDDRDPSFNGTWDLIGYGDEFTIRVPTTDINLPIPPGIYPPFKDVVVQTLNEVIVTINGVVFTDDKMEGFAPGANCVTLIPSIPTNRLLPFASLEQTMVLAPILPIPGYPTFEWDIDEYGAGDQVSRLGSSDARWSLAYSYGSRKWPDTNGTEEGKYWTTNCIESPRGGTWSWSGRRGSILLDL